MEIQEFLELLRGHATGYSFIYTSNQSSSSSSEEDEAGDKKNFSYNYADKEGFNASKIQLLEDTLYVLRKLNTKTISPYYDINVWGMVKMEDEDNITDIFLCKDNDVSDWLSFLSDTNEGFAFIGRSGIMALLVSVIFSQNLKLTLDGEANQDNGFKEDYGLITLESLQSHITENSPPPDNTAGEETPANGIDPVKMLGDIIDLTFYTFQVETVYNDIEKQEEVYNALKIETAALKQIVDDELGS